MAIIKKLSPARFIVLGFAVTIVIGALALLLPVVANEGVNVSVVDAFFTSTSAVCVTGLIAIDTADTFNGIGQTIVALLIQIGGLGVTSVGIGLIFLAGGKINFKERIMLKEAMNLDSLKGIVRMVRSVLLMTLCFELVGAILSFFVFSKDYPPLKALGISVFHSIAAFNNSGFDILGGYRSLIPYQDSVLLNLTTCGLIIFGGLGFIVIKEIIYKRSYKKFSLHTKVVLVSTTVLLIAGTIILYLTENISLLGAFFFSTSTRTAGFATYALDGFTNAGLFVIIILMFIGASPGSTGGGIKTTTAFVIMKSVYSSVTNKHCSAFKRQIPHDIIYKSFIIATLSMTVVCVNTLLLVILEPNYTFMQILFEVVSAFGTVGLSTGITPNLSDASKVIIIITMFIGRLSPFTMASIWTFRPLSNVRYSEENITIG